MKENFLKKISYKNLPEIILAASVIALGGFHVYISCAISIVLLVAIAYTCHKNGKFVFSTGLTSIATLVLVLAYGACCLWAVDKGVAVFGFFKFLPMLLFMLLLIQNEESKPFRAMPYVMLFMTISSAILMQFDAISDCFSVKGRLAGFIQYPNTFAILLLLCFIYTALKDKLKATDYIMLAVFLFGIVYSGSRTAFIITALTIIVLVLAIKNKKIKLSLILIALLLVAGATIYALVTNNFSTIGRFLTVSLKQSTFVGRILYAYDALPIILRHPFGLGYLGYFFSQTSFQSGVYSVRFIHNDLLQFLLDVGWVPTGLFLAAILRSFFKKGTSLKKRLMLTALLLHSLFEFNLQFISVCMILISLLDYNEGKKISLNVNSKILTTALITVAIAINVYFGTADVLNYFNRFELSDKLYSANTFNDLELIDMTDNMNLKFDLAVEISERNKYVTYPYDIKALYYYSQGDFKNVIYNEKAAMQMRRFEHDRAVEYCYMLINGITLYEKNNDKSSAQTCREELERTIEYIRSSEDRLSPLGKMINDQPDSSIPQDIKAAIND